MSYKEIDDTIKEWVEENNLFLQTDYKDCEVRSVQIAGEGRKKFQIWVDQPNEGVVEVHAWDFRKKRSDWSSTSKDLKSVLDDAFQQVCEWKI